MCHWRLSSRQPHAAAILRAHRPSAAALLHCQACRPERRAHLRLAIPAGSQFPARLWPGILPPEGRRLAAMAEQAPAPVLLQYCSSSSDSDADSRDDACSVDCDRAPPSVRAKRGRSPSAAAAAAAPDAKRHSLGPELPPAPKTATSRAPSCANRMDDARSTASTAGGAAPVLPASARAYEHVAGNWPTVVWLDCGSAEPRVRQAWPRIVGSRSQEASSRGTAAGSDGETPRPAPEPALSPAKRPDPAWTPVWDGGTSLPLHVTLTRPFALQQYQIDPFVRAVQAAVARPRTATPLAAAPAAAGAAAGGCAAPVPRPFTAELGALPDVLPSSTGAREFLVLPLVGRGRAAAVACTLAVDRVVRAFGGPPFFDHPKPHVSVAWRLRAAGGAALTSAEGSTDCTKAALPGDADGSASDDSEDGFGVVLARVRVSQVHVRCGDRRFSVPIG